jgi:hypothetical protein
MVPFIFGAYAAGFLHCSSNQKASPSANRESPFAMISDDPADIAAMTKAAHDARLVMLSDWDHLPSDQYMDVLKKTGYDIL